LDVFVSPVFAALGNFRLTDRQESQIVAFMRTLTDGYMPPGKPHSSPIPPHVQPGST
jgi:hypothetical protein